MVVGTALYSQSKSKVVFDSSLKEKYKSSENIKQIKAINAIKIESMRNKVKTHDSAKPASSELLASGSVSAAGSGEAKKLSNKKRKFGPGATNAKPGDSADSLGISPIRMLLAVIILIAAMGGFFFMLKKFGKKFTGTENTASLKVKSRLQLDSKNSVVIVGAHEQEFLLGVSPAGVNFLAKFASLDAEDEENDEENAIENKIKSGISFEKDLKAAVGSVNSEELKPVKELL